jgi:hypothetical protein
MATIDFKLYKILQYLNQKRNYAFFIHISTIFLTIDHLHLASQIFDMVLMHFVLKHLLITQ